MLKFSELATITGGNLAQLHVDQPIDRLLIDSRQLIVRPQSVFVAISGPRHDGHDYLVNTYQQGIRNFIVERPWLSPPADANILIVPNSVQALQDLAQNHRQQFDLPILGITGSNAKTLIKEWLYQLLPDKKVVKSPKSYNSQVGVPLSVWQLHAGADFAIFEAGISQPGEMANLEAVIRPTMGIFSNIGPAHDRGFRGLEEKVQEKALLFRNVHKVIYRKDHSLIHQVLNQELSTDQLLCWSDTESADVTFKIRVAAGLSFCEWQYRGRKGEVKVPFSDPASLENLMHCLTLLLFLDYSPEEIRRRVQNLESVPHRLSLKKGLHSCYLIDDTYNNDLAGLEIALEFMNQQPQAKSKTLILSDIQQSAQPDEELYGKVAALIQSKGVRNFCGIGKGLSKSKALFPDHHRFYIDTKDFLSARPEFHHELILIKGAREFAFERIVNQLQEKLHGTVLEIDLNALTYNLNHYRQMLPSATKIMVMVKAFAYGSGSQEVAHLLQYQGVDYLGVAYADEGITLRRDGIELPIMVMNPAPETFDQLLEHQLEPEIYSWELFVAYQRFCQQENRAMPIHLKIDTGMHRLGFELGQLEDFINQFQAFPLEVASIFSHLAASDDPNQKEFTGYQAATFIGAVEQLQAALNIRPLKHLLNSSGIVHYPEYTMDMVRLGVGLYGVGPKSLGLQNISTLKTTISQIKQLKKGETIGYGRAGHAQSDMTMATIAIGYADGYNRRNSNGVGKVLVREKLAPVVGNVCMDMTMIDISGIEAEVGEEVVIFNQDRTIDQIADDIGTIPYEILTQVSDRVKRVYFTQ